MQTGQKNLGNLMDFLEGQLNLLIESEEYKAFEKSEQRQTFISRIPSPSDDTPKYDTQCQSILYFLEEQKDYDFYGKMEQAFKVLYEEVQKDKQAALNFWSIDDDAVKSVTKPEDKRRACLQKIHGSRIFTTGASGNEHESMLAFKFFKAANQPWEDLKSQMDPFVRPLAWACGGREDSSSLASDQTAINDELEVQEIAALVSQAGLRHLRSIQAFSLVSEKSQLRKSADFESMDKVVKREQEIMQKFLAFCNAPQPIPNDIDYHQMMKKFTDPSLMYTTYIRPKTGAIYNQDDKLILVHVLDILNDREPKDALWLVIPGVVILACVVTMFAVGGPFALAAAGMGFIVGIAQVVEVIYLINHDNPSSAAVMHQCGMLKDINGKCANLRRLVNYWLPMCVVFIACAWLAVTLPGLVTALSLVMCGAAITHLYTMLSRRSKANNPQVYDQYIESLRPKQSSHHDSDMKSDGSTLEANALKNGSNAPQQGSPASQAGNRAACDTFLEQQNSTNKKTV